MDFLILLRIVFFCFSYYKKKLTHNKGTEYDELATVLLLAVSSSSGSSCHPDSSLNFLE